MLYKNTKTGAILDSPFPISGGDWVAYDTKPAEVMREKPVEAKARLPEDQTGMTKEEVMNELDALGIQYDKKAKKDDLIKLMMEA
ncbi:MAG: hypothetical protein E7K64_00820 [Clostridia bacterium]|nr:hypothetical protein [Clostridiales bacterium]MDU7433734.1 hypothetical protein [Anaerococcus vaginalis]MDU7504574.1 hypothetical protein [Clostridia bacterium]